MSDIYESALLFDFYGELLTEHQKKIYADRVYNDMSMSEIAEENGISLNGAMIHCRKTRKSFIWWNALRKPKKYRRL